ncbi:serine palmitoyltransferase component [Coelomomyces lativittatus]|nr:serine palmitoyltransferase component [Coelomomyces lativittatus]KAJ1501166.1 serine palmitoyltransferase component [Coelomomyces lativittatus]
MAPSLTSTKPSLYPKSTLKSSSHTPPPSSSSSSSSTTTSNNPSFPPSSVNTFLSTPSCHVPPSISTPSPSCLNLTNNEKHHPGSSSSTHKGPPLTPTVDSAPLFTLMTTYFSYLILIVFGHVRDFLGRWFEKETTKHLRPHDGYAPLVSDFESFYSRRLYHRIRDCFARPVTKVPGAYVHVLHRHVTSSPFLSATTMTTSSSSSTTIPTTTSTSPLPTSTLTPTPTSTLFTFSTFPFKRKLHPVLPLDPVDSGTSFPSPWSSTWNGDGDGGDCGRGRGRQGGGSWSSSVTLCLNLASYNYLGFAQTEGPCASSVVMTIQQLGMNLGSTRNEVGLHQSHLLLESQVASFLGTEDAVCINMGFATNTSTLPLLVSKVCYQTLLEFNERQK